MVRSKVITYSFVFIAAYLVAAFCYLFFYGGFPISIPGMRDSGFLGTCLQGLILFAIIVVIDFFKKRELAQEQRQLELLANKKDQELVETNLILTEEINSRKSIQKSLSCAVEEWQFTFDVITSPVIVLDDRFQVLKVNRAAVRLFGGQKKILEQKCSDLFGLSETSAKECERKIKKNIQTGNEFELQHKTLKKVLRMACVPVTYQDKVASYVMTIKDVTLQKELETQLIQAQKMEAIATLAGGIAHDFNNILGAIMGNADLVLYQLPKTPGQPEGIAGVGPKPRITLAKIAEHLQSIKMAGERAKDLVSQILAFSRRSESMLQAIDITPIVKEVIKLLRASLPATIEIHGNVGANLCYVNADPTQIHQILMNLSTNAAQAMEGHGGSLEISLLETVIDSDSSKQYHDLVPGKYLVLTVKDTGSGMTESVQAKIFDPFFSTRDVGQGSGMGLSVIHGIVAAHNGVIDVQSEVGKGSVFKVFLPAVEKKAALVQNIVVATPGNAETVLFVDDEEEIVKMRIRMLEYLGYKVLAATSGEAALTLLRDNHDKVDLVITDLTMPKMTGIQLAAKIMKDYPELPVILCSGYSETVIHEEAEQAGIKKFMAKPLEMRALANIIREVLTIPKG